MSEGWFPSMGHTPFVLKSVKSVYQVKCSMLCCMLQGTLT